MDAVDIEIQVRKDCYKSGYEQGKKDMAKEIILWLENMDKRGMTVPFNMVLRQLKERHSIEVE